MIDERDIERLKEVFVTRKECNETTDAFTNKFSKDLVRLAVIESQLKTITWILYAVAGGTISILLKSLLGG